MNILNRFLKYVNFTTTSDESSESCPSTPQQLVLAKYLTEELESIGLSQVKMDKNGYVYGLLPATAKRENDTPIGFISHMDTSPDFSGVSPKPQIIEDYDGADVLLKGSGATLKVDDFPTLKWLKGRTLITTDGTTLL
ncbi:MAG: peptidase T, partial [Fibrobacter sp.]|nr:peptidase T [Fibrobacter sp.]